jgi:hypothetical protein
MPEIIPYHDSTSELFDAYKTIQEVKQSAQKIAMDQALANQHIQSAHTLDQMNQARLQIEQQQASEFTSPEGIKSRARAQDTALAQGDANLNLTNQRISQNEDIHPLILAHQQQAIRLARISADSAQQELNDLHDKISDGAKVRKMTVDGLKYKMIQDGMDPHTSSLMSQIKGEELANQLKNLPATFAAQGTALEESVKQLTQKTQMNAGSMIEHAASVVNTVGADAAKGLFKGMPGYEAMSTMPSDAMRQGGNQKDQIFRMQVHLMKDPSTPDTVKNAIIDTLGQQIAIQSGYKAPTAQEKTAAGLNMPGANLDTTILDQAKVIAKHILEKTQIDPKSGEVIPPGMLSVSDQRENVLAPLQGGQMTPPVTVTPPAQAPAGNQTLPPNAPITPNQVQKTPTTPNDIVGSLDRINKVLAKNPESHTMTFSSNRTSSPNDATEGFNQDSSAADNLLTNASDPKYTVQSNGFVYDRTGIGAQKGKISPNSLKKTMGESSIPDEQFRSRLSERIKMGLDQDKSASNAQAARFAAIMSQAAKGYNEGGPQGLKNVIDVAKVKLFPPGPNTLTAVQLSALKSLGRDYAIE